MLLNHKWVALFFLFGASFAACQKKLSNDEPQTPKQPQVAISIPDKSPVNEMRVAENGELTSPNITAGIDITKYIQLGHFDCRQWGEQDSVKNSAIYEKRKESRLKKVREIIWDHWQLGKQSYIRVTYDSIDAVTTDHIFIETNNEGQRQVRLRTLCTYGPPVNETEVFHHLDFERVGKAPHYLRFINSAGKTHKLL